MARKGDWIQTYTGKQFWPLDPRVGEIDIEDIAHALSLACRYNGHCLEFYSVAQHSVIISKMIEPEFKLWALLHDAAEAYISDVPRPLKRDMPDYKVIEDAIMRKVCRKFGLPPTMPPRVKELDNRILLDERRCLMRKARGDWKLKDVELGIDIRPWTWEESKRQFRNQYRKLST